MYNTPLEAVNEVPDLFVGVLVLGIVFLLCYLVRRMWSDSTWTY